VFCCLKLETRNIEVVITDLSRLVSLLYYITKDQYTLCSAVACRHVLRVHPLNLCFCVI